jgi:hypothetical protein
MRTIREAIAEIRKMDKGTAVSEHYIRQLVLKNEIPYCIAGTHRYLVNLDALFDYLQCGENAERAQESGIRKVSERIRPLTMN